MLAIFTLAENKKNKWKLQNQEHGLIKTDSGLK